MGRSPDRSTAPPCPDEYWELLQGVDWNGLAKRLIRAEMARAGVNYAELRRRLALMGIEETEPNLRNKINRGLFSMTFGMQCYAAMRKWNIQFGEPGHPFADLLEPPWNR